MVSAASTVYKGNEGQHSLNSKVALLSQGATYIPAPTTCKEMFWRGRAPGTCSYMLAATDAGKPMRLEPVIQRGESPGEQVFLACVISRPSID